MFAYCGNSPVSYKDDTGNAYNPSFVTTMLADEKGGGYGYIVNQKLEPYGSKTLGGYNVSYNGCGAIASYNALISLGNGKSFDEVLDYYNADSSRILLNGKFGILPHQVSRFFESLDYSVVLTDDIDAIDLYSKTADASIMFYVFPTTYYGIEVVGAHFIEYHQTRNCYTAYNTSEGQGRHSFNYPSDYGYKGTRCYAIAIFIYN